MKNLQRGYLSIGLLILIIVICLGGVYYFFIKNNIEEPVLNTSVSPEIKSETKTEKVYILSEFVKPNQSMNYSLKKISDVDYELNIDGFQTLLRIKAYSKMTGQDSTDLIFDSYSEGSIGGNFNKGDILFTFTSGDTENSLIVLSWDKLKPIDPKNNKTATFILK